MNAANAQSPTRHELIAAGLFLLGYLVLFSWFSHGIIAGAKWLLALVVVLGVPGYCILLYLWNGLEFLGKVALSPFVGMGATPFLMFVFSQLGVKAVAAWFALLIALIAIALIIIKHMQQHREPGKSKEHHAHQQ